MEHIGISQNRSLPSSENNGEIRTSGKKDRLKENEPNQIANAGFKGAQIMADNIRGGLNASKNMRENNDEKNKTDIKKIIAKYTKYGAEITPEMESSALILKQGGFSDRTIIKWLNGVDTQDAEKAVLLLSLDFKEDTALQNALVLNKDEILKVKTAIDGGFCPNEASNIALKLNEEQFERALNIRKAGFGEQFAYDYALDLTPEQTQNIIDLKKMGFDTLNISTTMDLNETKKEFENYKSQGKDVVSSFLLTFVSNRNKSQEKEHFIENITKLSSKATSKTTRFIEEYMNNDSSEFDDYLSSFNDYLSNINAKELYKLAPNVKDYSIEQIIQFMEYHFKAGDETFNDDNLKLNENFTVYLMKNYTNADKLTELLLVFPNVKRNVGEIPQEWLDKVPDENKTEAEEEIYEITAEFQKDKDIKSYRQKLSKILKKPVEISFIDYGAYGICYKISTEGAQDKCLKLFGNLEYNPYYNQHGEHIEVQTALFANKHSNDYVKMYFGRVSGLNNKDGFMVTQYLDDDIIPEDCKDIEAGYIIDTADISNNHNIINGKIIDYGSTKVYPEDKK